MYLQLIGGGLILGGNIYLHYSLDPYLGVSIILFLSDNVRLVIFSPELSY
jgi:hypothetical protein